MIDPITIECIVCGALFGIPRANAEHCPTCLARHVRDSGVNVTLDEQHPLTIASHAHPRAIEHAKR